MCGCARFGRRRGHWSWRHWYLVFQCALLRHGMAAAHALFQLFRGRDQRAGGVVWAPVCRLSSGAVSSMLQPGDDAGSAARRGQAASHCPLVRSIWSGRTGASSSDPCRRELAEICAQAFVGVDFFLFGYTIALIAVNFYTGERLSVYAAAFGLGGMALTFGTPMIFYPLAAATLGLALLGLRASLQVLSVGRPGNHRDLQGAFSEPGLASRLARACA